MLQYDITFMTPTLQRYYAHISSTTFGQNFSNPFLSEPPPPPPSFRGQMSVENLYQCESPRSYVLMALEWKECRRWRGSLLLLLLVMWSEGRVGS